MKAMLLAAGSGTRLRPLTDKVPKPLAPIANEPLLSRTLTWLKWEGVDDAVINLHHLGEHIMSEIDVRPLNGPRVWFSIESVLLGTSGAVRKCADYLSEGPFFVIYGDNLIDADLSKLMRFHQDTASEATIALFSPDDPTACGMVEIDQNARVTNFVEKPKPGESHATMANAGIYIIEPHLLKTLPDGFSDFGSDIFPMWLQDNVKISATALGGYLQDTGTPDRYRKANWDILTGRLRHKPLGVTVGSSIMAAGTIVDPSARLDHCVIGEACTIEENAMLQNCILWNEATIERGAMLRNVIVGSGAIVPVDAFVSDAILA